MYFPFASDCACGQNHLPLVANTKSPPPAKGSSASRGCFPLPICVSRASCVRLTISRTLDCRRCKRARHRTSPPTMCNQYNDNSDSVAQKSIYRMFIPSKVLSQYSVPSPTLLTPLSSPCPPPIPDHSFTFPPPETLRSNRRLAPWIVSYSTRFCSSHPSRWL